MYFNEKRCETIKQNNLGGITTQLL